MNDRKGLNRDGKKCQILLSTARGSYDKDKQIRPSPGMIKENKISGRVVIALFNWYSNVAIFLWYPTYWMMNESANVLRANCSDDYAIFCNRALERLCKLYDGRRIEATFVYWILWDFQQVCYRKTRNASSFSWLSTRLYVNSQWCSSMSKTPANVKTNLLPSMETVSEQSIKSNIWDNLYLGTSL